MNSSAQTVYSIGIFSVMLVSILALSFGNLSESSSATLQSVITGCFALATPNIAAAMKRKPKPDTLEKSD
jgi:hypothetical protein